MATTIIVDRTSIDPVYEQIAGQIRLRIASGELAPGATLPSVRTLALELGVNLNTVARAYRLLRHEGFLKIESREGARVIARATRIEARERQRLSEELRLLLARMRQAGLSQGDLRRIVDKELERIREDRVARVG